MDLFNNGLVIADLHIRKNERYSPEEGFRLWKQPEFLLKRMKSLIQPKNIGFICILGDILDTPACLPEETHVLNFMFKEMNSWGIPILYILGQHDVNLNRYEINKIDYSKKSNVTVVSEMYENIFYVHDRYFNWNNNGKIFKLYFSNYSDPLVYPEEKPDCWLTHCKIGFTEIDKDKFGVMIAGDIHDHIKSSNCYTVGTPYQHKSHEQEVGVIGFLTSNEQEIIFDRIPSDSEEFKFLRLPKESKKLTYKTESGEIIPLNLSLDTFNQEVNALLKEKGLLELHKKIDSSNVPNPCNLFFRLRYLKIKNYRSIKEYELDFLDYEKILFLYGTNGSGKSTILSALKNVFCGSTAIISDDVSFWLKDKKNKDVCRIEVELEYEDKIYNIIRGPSFLEFYIDKEQRTANDMKSLDRMIEMELPFVDYIDILIPEPGQRLFSKEIGQKLLNRCINLDVFDFYKESAVKLETLYKEEYNSMQNNLAIENGKLNNLQQDKENLLSLMNQIENITKESEIMLLSKKELLNNFLIKKSEINGRKKSLSHMMGIYSDEIKELTIEDINSKILENQTIIDSYSDNQRKKEERDFLYNQIMDLYNQYKSFEGLKKNIDIEVTESLEELEKQKEFINQTNETIKKENDQILTKKSFLVMKINELKNFISKKEYICPTCGQQVKTDTTQYEKELLEKEQELEKIPQQKALVDVVNIISKINALKDKQHNLDIEQKLEEIKIKGNELKIQYNNIQIDKELEKIDIDLYKGLLNKYKNYLTNYSNYLEYKQLYDTCISDEIAYFQSVKEQFGSEDVNLEELLSNVTKQLSSIESRKNYEMLYQKKEHDIELTIENINKIEKDLSEKQKERDLWKSYINIMDHSNLESIPYTLLDKLVYNFNTDIFKITTKRTQKNNKKVFDLTMNLKVSEGFWVPYKNASSGQQLLMEIIFFNNVATFLGGLGFLSLDENLNVAAEELYNELNEILSSIPINKMVVVSHNQRLSCYDKILLLHRDEQGVTQIENN